MSVLAARVTPGTRAMLKASTSTISQQASVSTATVYSAVDNVSEFNLHSYLFYEAGQFWCMWSTAVGPDEDVSGQRVRYATSADGATWTQGGYITPAPATNFRYIARGFWKRGSEFIALCSLDESNLGYFGPSLDLRKFVWNGSSWADGGSALDGYINNFPPEQLPDGDWIMTARDPDDAIHYARGDIGSWSITAVNYGSVDLNEPNINIISDEILTATFRNDDGYTMWRAISTDLGETWPDPRPTNFVDAGSKHFTLKLSDGRFVQASNIALPDNRTGLHIAISDDGLTFDRVRILINTATSVQFPATAKLPGYMYPHMIEQGGTLYVAHSRNKEDILVSRVAISDID